MLIFKSTSSYEAALSRQAMDIVEQLTTEMGAELHDDLIQKISSLRLYADRLHQCRENPGEIELLLVSMNADFQEVMYSIRSISRRLAPAGTEGESFTQVLKILCQHFERPGGGTIHLQTKGDEVTVPEHSKVYLYRIIQELIQNAIKHSSAWHIWVTITWSSHELILEVEDDGSGFIKVQESVSTLEAKHNTLKMRAHAIGAAIHYFHGKKGLLAQVCYPIA